MALAAIKRDRTIGELASEYGFPLFTVDRLQAAARAARLKEQTEGLIAKREAEWAKLMQEEEARFQRLTPADEATPRA